MTKSQKLKKGDDGPHLGDDVLTNDWKRVTGKERQSLETKIQARKLGIQAV